MQISIIAAAIMALLLVALSVRVSLVRRADGVSVGDGGNPELLLRIRAQANCAEYVPLGLLLLLLAEQAVGSDAAVGGLALLFVTARLAHPVGMAMPAPNAARIFGTAGTWLAMVGLALMLLWRAATR